ncbi:MAG: outer membrane protein assembly factor BamE [Methylophilaceae bacterium]|nr:outer membrane protein assembly factor BamE [Methylophilaceae bacterium]
MDIQQGNVVTPKMMMQLRPGMTKSQVRFIMGSPLLVDSFHADRWDYFYQMRKDGKIIEQRRVVLEFEGDSLARVRGDVIPAGSEGSTPPVTSAGKIEPKSVAKPAKEKEKGLFDKLKFWERDEPAAAKAQPPSAQPMSGTAQPSQPAPLSEPQPQAAPAPEKPGTPAPVPAEQPPSSIGEAAPKPEARSQAAVPATDESASKPREEKKRWLDRLKFWRDDDKPNPPEHKPAEAPKPDPIKAEPSKPLESKSAQPTSPVPAKAEPPRPSAEKSVPVQSKGEARPKTPPQPMELPPEDAPDFFEKMLEKIGF